MVILIPFFCVGSVIAGEEEKKVRERKRARNTD